MTEWLARLNKLYKFKTSIAAQAYISVQVQNTLIDYGRTDIDISCKVNGTSLESIQVIQLKRNNTNIVSISNGSVSWQDTELETRSKKNASIQNILSSYLQIKIMACDVDQPKDEGSYQCALGATGNDIPFISSDSNIVNLKITGIDLILNLFVIRFANTCVKCLL